MKKFDPQIYPRKLYIVESYDEIMELFTNRDKDATSPPDTDGYGAITFPVIEKSTGHYGVAVYFVEDITIGSIAHEADHVVSSMWQDLGVDFDFLKDEHHAYMLGWVAKCIGEGLGLKVVKEE